MSGPLSFWLYTTGGSLIYHGMKGLLGFEPAWRDCAASAYWVASCMVALHFGLVGREPRP